jgi:uncharacterized protein
MKFADASWRVAWVLPGEGRHRDALEMLNLLGKSEQVLTTSHVVGETWTDLRQKDSHMAAVMFLDRVDELVRALKLVVHRLTESQERMSWVWLRRLDERVYSFVDATSFQAMRDRRLREVLAFDQDISAAGFIRLGP